MTKKKDKTKSKLNVAGHQVVYLQTVGKNGKLGKAKPYVATAVLPKTK